MNDDLTLNLTAADLKNLDALLEKLRREHPELDIILEAVEETDEDAAN